MGRPKGAKNKATILREHAEAQARIQRIMAEEDQPEVFFCVTCHKKFTRQKDNFYPSQSQLWAGNNHFMPSCKSCVDKLYDHYCKTLGNEEDAAKRVCMRFDMYYNDKIFRSTANRAANLTRMAAWVKQLNIVQYRNKTFDDYLEEVNGRIINEVDDNSQAVDAKGRVSQRMLDFWGTSMKDQEYLFLDREYKDWTTRYECKTKAQEVLFKNICIGELACERAAKSGDVKDIKTANDNLQSLLGSANIKPNQTNDNALAEANTFGTLIEKWERTDPVPEPDPVWKDVDGIGHYFRVWVLGTLCELFKLKNPYKEEYDAEMERYTAHKPEYYMNDDEPDEAAEAAK